MRLTSFKDKLPTVKGKWIIVIDVLAILIVGIYCVEFNRASFSFFWGRTLQGDLAALWQSIYNIAFHSKPISSFNCSVHAYYPLITTQDLFQELPNISGCHQLGIHFHLWIYPMALLARLYPFPTLLLVVQTFVLGLAGLLLYYIGVKWIQNRILAVLILFSFITNIFLHGLNLNEFHFDAFFPVLIFLAAYFYSKKQILPLIFSFVAMLFLKESGSLVVFGFGCLMLVESICERKVSPLLIFVMIMGPLALYLITQHFIPLLSYTGHYIFGGIYGCPLGSSAGQIIKNSILDPMMLWKTLSSLQNKNYLLFLILSTSPLVFLRPQWLLVAGPLLFINLITSNGAMKIAVGQYSAAIFPVFYLAMVASLKRAKTLSRKWRYGIYTIFFISLLFNIRTFYLESHYFKSQLNLTKYKAEIQTLTKIPENSIVCSDSFWVSYLASRKDLYLTPVNIAKCDIVVWDNSPVLWYMPNEVREKIKSYVSSNFKISETFDNMTVYKR